MREKKREKIRARERRNDMVDLKEKRNIYVTCVAAPGRFHDASERKAVYFPGRSSKVSGKPPAILLLLA